jgi:hypothetical protein
VGPYTSRDAAFLWRGGRPKPYQRELATEMPELKKFDDLVIDDETPRALLHALLGRWGDDAMRSIVKWVEVELLRLDSAAEMRWRLSYSSESYNACARHKAEEWSERREAQARRLNEAMAIFQASLEAAVTKSLLLTIGTLTKAASDSVMGEVEEKIKAAEKAAETRHKRASRRELKAVFNIEQPALGRREKYAPTDVERRSVAIIRAIGAGKKEMGKVALVFYSDIGPADTDAAKKLASTYKDLNGSEKCKARDKYRRLLEGKELTYEGLLKKAKRKSRKKGR